MALNYTKSAGLPLALVIISTLSGCKRDGEATTSPEETSGSAAPSSAESAAAGDFVMRSVPSLDAIASEIDQASRLARDMLFYDLSAWHGTDAIVESGSTGAPFAGFLVTSESATTSDLWMVGDLGDGVLGLVARARCDLRASSTLCAVVPDFSPRPMTQEEETRRKAIRTASSDPFFRPVQEAYNHIVLKGSDYGLDVGWIVYIVAATADPNVIPVGRHFRFDLDPEGTRVLRRRASHRSVIESRRDQLPEGGKLVSLANTAVLDAYPTEFQLYVSGLWEVGLTIVGCDGSMWSVDGLNVEQLEGSRPGAKCPDPWSEVR